MPENSAQILQALLSAGNAGTNNSSGLLTGQADDPLQKLLQLTVLRDVLSNQTKASAEGSIIDPQKLTEGQTPKTRIAGGGNIPFIIRGAKPNKLTQIFSGLNNALTGFNKGRANKKSRERDKQFQELTELLLSRAFADAQGSDDTLL